MELTDQTKRELYCLVYDLLGDTYRQSARHAVRIGADSLGLSSLRNLRTYHVGAGYGQDAMEALVLGAASYEAEDISANGNLEALVWRASLESVRDHFHANDWCTRLYSPELLDRACRRLSAWRRRLAKSSVWREQGIKIHDMDSFAPRERQACHVLIANHVMHYMNDEGMRATARRVPIRLRERIQPGGVQVWSLFDIFAQPRDRRLDLERWEEGVFGSAYYHAVMAEVQNILDGDRVVYRWPESTFGRNNEGGSAREQDHSWSQGGIVTRGFTSSKVTLRMRVDAYLRVALISPVCWMTDRSVEEVMAIVNTAVLAASKKVPCSLLEKRYHRWVYHLCYQRTD